MYLHFCSFTNMASSTNSEDNCWGWIAEHPNAMSTSSSGVVCSCIFLIFSSREIIESEPQNTVDGFILCLQFFTPGRDYACCVTAVCNYTPAARAHQVLEGVFLA